MPSLSISPSAQPNPLNLMAVLRNEPKQQTFADLSGQPPDSWPEAVGGNNGSDLWPKSEPCHQCRVARFRWAGAVCRLPDLGRAADAVQHASLADPAPAGAVQPSASCQR